MAAMFRRISAPISADSWARALIYLSTTIDYRNGLIKFDYHQK